MNLNKSLSKNIQDIIIMSKENLISISQQKSGEYQGFRSKSGINQENNFAVRPVFLIHHMCG
jgi:hypothetical protein